MNARQKAKHWKKRYQELANLPVRPTVVVSERKIETLKYTTVINDEVRIRQISENTALQKMMLDSVKRRIAETAEFYVDVSVEKDEINPSMRITGRLDVATPFHDNHDIYNTHWDVMLASNVPMIIS